MHSLAVSGRRNLRSPWVRLASWLIACPYSIFPKHFISSRTKWRCRRQKEDHAPARDPKSPTTTSKEFQVFPPRSRCHPLTPIISCHRYTPPRHHPSSPGNTGSIQLPRNNTSRLEQPLRSDHGEHLLGILTQRHLPAALQYTQRAPCGGTSEQRRFVFQVGTGIAARAIVSLTARWSVTMR